MYIGLGPELKKKQNANPQTNKTNAQTPPPPSPQKTQTKMTDKFIHTMYITALRIPQMVVIRPLK